MNLGGLVPNFNNFLRHNFLKPVDLGWVWLTVTYKMKIVVPGK